MQGLVMEDLAADRRMLTGIEALLEHVPLF
jgi:hypothetical protein